MNIPNTLSIIRIIMVPVFAMVFFSGSSYASGYAALIYIAAMATDVLDGAIARHYGQITKLGRILDPLADKLMTFTVLVCIFIKGIVPQWAVILFFTKELLMGLGALIMLKRTHDVIPSDYLGKSSTVVFFGVCVILMLLPGIPKETAAIMVAAALLLSFVALIHYLIKFVKYIKRTDAK